jgi:hypothetical protein
MPVQWIEYKGKKILFADYRGLKSEDLMLQNLKEEGEFYKSSNSKILSLSDFRDTYISKEFMDKVKQLGKEHKEKTAKSAVLGITGIKNIFINVYTAFTGESLKCFNDEISAKEYLIN